MTTTTKKLRPKRVMPFETFSPEVKEAIIKRDGNKCICKCEKCDGYGHSIDHLVKNTKANRKKYGNLLQSKQNGNLMSEYCHRNCISTEEMNTKRKWLTEKFDLLVE